MKKIFLITAALSFTGFAGLANAQTIKEGEWTMAITVKVAGMEEEMAAAMEGMSQEEKAMMAQMMGGMMDMGAGGMTITRTQCISNDDPVPQADDEEGCSTTHQTRGNTVTFETVCPDGSSSGTVTYQGNSMKGLIASEADGEEVIIEISGEYVGPCS